MVTIAEHLSPVTERYAKLSPKIYEEIDFFRARLWQKSVPEVQRYYPEFDRPALVITAGKRMRKLFPGQYADVEEARFILNELVDIYSVDYAHCASKKEAQSLIFRNASFGACMLGREACYGDLHMHLSNLEKHAVYYEHLLHHDDPFTALEKGDMRTVGLFLSLGLKRAVEFLEADGLCITTVPPSLYYDAQDEMFRPDMRVVGTWYYLYHSLLQWCAGSKSTS